MIRLPDKIEHVRVLDVLPYSRNARVHSDAQVAQIAASIREFGWTAPLLIDAQGGIIAGHGRLMAAHRLGMETVPAIRLDYLTPAQRRALVLADNQLGLTSSWNYDMLAVELDDLRDEGFDLSLTGFDAQALNELIGTPNLGPEQDAAEPQSASEARTCPHCGGEL